MIGTTKSTAKEGVGRRERRKSKENEHQMEIGAQAQEYLQDSKPPHSNMPAKNT